MQKHEREGSGEHFPLVSYECGKELKNRSLDPVKDKEERKMSEYAIEMLGITKKFPGIIANDHITLQLKKGEIHALLGENGAVLPPPSEPSAGF